MRSTRYWPLECYVVRDSVHRKLPDISVWELIVRIDLDVCNILTVSNCKFSFALQWLVSEVPETEQFRQR